MSTRSRVPSPESIPMELRALLEEKIRIRAYQIFQERGCHHGSALQDWLQAEADVLSHATASRVVKAPTVRKARPRKSG